MSKTVDYQCLIVFCPRAYVEETVDDLNMTLAEFVNRLGVSSKLISHLIDGQDSVSVATADKLAHANGGYGNPA
ncbi:helix-turn-helix domain-containing protein [Lacticaseibacillus hegangensis]|uniref:HTH cro/C1-type domain-containing protein n=1 Tax=Lacticaseibacillus hegangensis TaxID=2486010 RepID=A0ABW4CWK7_9LACO|nr:hypothetical protein [Lacticaseibacillus hegangensis]